MIPPKPFIPLALFALAFAGALFVLRTPAPPTAAPAAAMPARVAEPLAAREELAASEELTASEESAASRDPSIAARRLSALSRPATEGFSIEEAIDALTYGPPDDRVRAIQSLSTTAPSDGALARVRGSLRLASTDEDPDIAARAQDAYDSLLNREDP